MSKTIKMTEGVNPIKIRINNGPEQTYVAGATYTVPDDVYALIVNNLKEVPKASDEVQPVLPGTTRRDAGKFLKVGEDGNYILGDAATVEVNPEEIPQDADEVRGLTVDSETYKVLSHLKYTDIPVASTAFVENSTYDGYTYRAAIPLQNAPDGTGVDASCFPIVVFGPTEANSGNYAPIAQTYDGGVYIYAKVNTAITIPVIYILK